MEDGRTDVKKGGAEWMDGKRKPRFVKRSAREGHAVPMQARDGQTAGSLVCRKAHVGRGEEVMMETDYCIDVRRGPEIRVEVRLAVADGRHRVVFISGHYYDTIRSGEILTHVPKIDR